MVRILINRHRIAYNLENPEMALPPVSVHRGKRVEYGYNLTIVGSSKLRYRPGKPLKCGATVWIEAADAYFTDHTGE